MSSWFCYSIYSDENDYKLINTYSENFLSKLSYEQKKLDSNHKLEKNDVNFETPLGTLLQCCRSYDNINKILEEDSYLTKNKKINLLRNFKLMTDILSELLENNTTLKNTTFYLYRGDTRNLPIGHLFGNRLVSFSLNPKIAYDFSKQPLGDGIGSVINIQCKLNKFMIPIMKNCRNRTLRYYQTDAFYNEEEILFLPNIISSINLNSNVPVLALEMKTGYNYWYSKAKNMEPYLDLIFDNIPTIRTTDLYQTLNSHRFNWQTPDKNYLTFLWTTLQNFLPLNDTDEIPYDIKTKIMEFFYPLSNTDSTDYIKNYVYDVVAKENLRVYGERLVMNDHKVNFINAIIVCMHEGGGSYYHKYLKYKQKYLSIKSK